MPSLSVPPTPRQTARHRLTSPYPVLPAAPTFVATSAVASPKSSARFLTLLPLALLALLLLFLSPFPSRSSIPPLLPPPFSNFTVAARTVSLPRLDLPPSASAFCTALLASPHPHDRACSRSSVNHTCTSGLHAGRPVFFGGHAQDFYVWTRHFRHLSRPGIYVDLATNDPVSMSNTFFFDRCANWQGICVEANPTYLEKIFRLRSCDLVPTCVSSRDGGAVQFNLEGQKGAVIGDTNRHASTSTSSPVAVLSMRCLSLKSLLARGDVTVVDFLSLDIEGHELTALHGVDWGRVRINVIVVEVTGKTIGGLEDFLQTKGYVRHTPDLDDRSKRTRLLGEDAVFVRDDVIWGNPV